MRVDSRITELIRPTVEHLGFELWGVEQHGTGKRSRVCVYIDSDEGITFDDCESVSRQLVTLLDVENALADNQVLEVSSPGLDRKLFNQSQYLKHVGEEVDVRLNFAIGGSKRIRGIMSECNDHEFIVNDCCIDFDKVQSTRLVPRFDWGTG